MRDLLTVIAETVSCLHAHELVALHALSACVPALTLFSMDVMIVAARPRLLADGEPSSDDDQALGWQDAVKYLAVSALRVSARCL